MRCGSLILSDEDMLKLNDNSTDALGLTQETPPPVPYNPRDDPNLIIPNSVNMTNLPNKTNKFNNNTSGMPLPPLTPSPFQDLANSTNNSTNDTSNGTATDVEAEVKFKRDEVRSYNDQMINGTKLDFRRVKYIPFLTLTP